MNGGVFGSGRRYDTLGVFDHIVIPIGTSAVELKYSTTAKPGRQMLVVYNDSNNTVYLGRNYVTATGSTKGIPLVKGQYVSVMSTEETAWYAIAESAGNNLIVFEYA